MLRLKDYLPIEIVDQGSDMMVESWTKYLGTVNQGISVYRTRHSFGDHRSFSSLNLGARQNAGSESVIRQWLIGTLWIALSRWALRGLLAPSSLPRRVTPRVRPVGSGTANETP